MDYHNWNSAKKVCVIGAGTMGSGIAAHLANIGFQVSLLDLTRETAQAGFDRALAIKPPHLYLPETAHQIQLGGISENLSLVSEADWVCEAIVEKIGLKRALFEKIEPLLRPDAMISTNTSGLEISLLAEGRSDAFRQKFLGTHFFNPPRFLKLLELIPTNETDPRAVEAFARFLEDRAARRVIVAKDTPGFIANRFGMWSMFHAVHTAEKLGLSTEVVDAICGPFLGRPRSAAMRLNDLVGLDIMLDIAHNLQARCPNDPHMDVLNTPRSIATLIERGALGAKSGAGFYRKEGKEMFVFDLGTMAYRNVLEIDLPSLQENGKKPLGERIRLTLAAKDEAGEFLRNHLIPVLRYADYLKEEISHSVLDFDRVMKWGFAWEAGPFELIDAIGADVLGMDVRPYYSGNCQRSFNCDFTVMKSEPEYATVRDFPIKSTYPDFTVRDLGDGVDAICLTTKMGSITPGFVTDMSRMLDEGSLNRIVLTSEARSFSVGYDLRIFSQKISQRDWEGIDEELFKLQKLTLRLGQIPSVAAVFGHCLGAGTELAIGCTITCSHPEATIGLPEAKVGLIPGGGGTALIALRTQALGAKRSTEVFQNISVGSVSLCGDDAKRLGILRETDVTCYHPDRLISTARSLALTASPEIRESWTKPVSPLSGMMSNAIQELKSRGDFSSHDELIADQIRHVFTKPDTLEGALAEERIGFLALCKAGLTVARINHMLESGKPLRN